MNINKKILNQCLSMSDLSKEFFECFSKTTQGETIKLSVALAKLGIELDWFEPLNPNVSDHILRQLHATICFLGDLSILDEMEKSKKEKQDLCSLVESMEKLASKTNQLVLNEEQTKLKLDNIKQMNQQKKALEEKTSLSNDGLQNSFLKNEIAKNEKLKMEIDLLEKNLNKMELFDLSNEKFLDDCINKMKEKYKSSLGTS